MANEIGMAPVSIHVNVPEWVSRKTPRYKPLMPPKYMLGLPYEKYTRIYRKVLGKLDPEQVLGELMDMGKHNDVIALMSWCNPPFSLIKFCHRRIVAIWLDENTDCGYIPELFHPYCHNTILNI